MLVLGSIVWKFFSFYLFPSIHHTVIENKKGGGRGKTLKHKFSVAINIGVFHYPVNESFNFHCIG